MANSGINKAQVKKARDALVARGVNPSIDAVRVELGNTGSKTTISRYLGELRAEGASRLGSTDALSAVLRNMVANLADQIQQEALAVVAQGSDACTAEINRIEEILAQREQQLHQSQERCALLGARIDKAERASEALGAANTDLSLALERHKQQLQDQTALLAQKDRQIQSLEEKHQHARNALEHFRTSHKDQREQELRRHELQVQQLQAETRQLGQTLSLKQAEITQLTTDNARLAAQVSELGKHLRTRDQQMDSLTSKVRSLESAVAVAHARLELAEQQHEASRAQANTLTGELAVLRHSSTALEKELASTLTELRVKSELFDTLQQRLQ